MSKELPGGAVEVPCPVEGCDNWTLSPDEPCVECAHKEML